MAIVKIFCACGKEIWSELPDYRKTELTLEAVERDAECSDCVTKKALARWHEKV